VDIVASDHPVRRLARENRRGLVSGITSVCSAHRYVIEAAMERALARDSYVLIESTSNQVNQFGGYTGMAPTDFVAYVELIAETTGLNRDLIILGGDHLGPNPWKNEAANTALSKAKDMITEYVKAGYTKIHLDASMPLGGDLDDGLVTLPPQVVAERTALLCRAAEDSYHRYRGSNGDNKPVYVIGTEVPVPGGTRQNEVIEVTHPEDFRQTVELTKVAFERFGLEEAYERIVAVVVQPGVEFGTWGVHDYDRKAASKLTQALDEFPWLVFEGHSTDYQLPEKLKQLVEDGVAILKVGPALTFAMREALFALDAIESELFHGEEKQSQLRLVLDDVMRARPEYWQDYYQGTESEIRLARKYSLSDRSRYYWMLPEVQCAVGHLVANLEREKIPLTLLSQYMPDQYRRVRQGLLACDPRSLVKDKIGNVLEGYYYAVGESL
jgi:D-tagatose-1,6-bisphosphate aldolase subunit GatZ/KbaZ